MPTGSPAARVARNAGARAAGEILGKVAALGLMAVLARRVGPHGLGVFLFALAWAELSLILVGPGLDRAYSRRIARERHRVGELLPGVAGSQLARAVPLIALSWAALWAFGYEGTTRDAVYVLTASFVLDALRNSLFSGLEGIERADAIGLVLAVQRILSAALGLAVLVVLDLGLVAVAGGYLAASVVALAMSLRILHRLAGPLRPALRWRAAPELREKARQLATQELLSAGIARFDVVLVSLLAGAAAAGVYGGAYRLLEATLFVSTALASAFVAMFTYLDADSDPPIGAVVSRALKLSLTLLTPIGVAFAILPGPILVLFYGGSFEDAADTLRILAPVVVLLGTVMLTSALAASRGNPRRLVAAFAAGLVVNVAANLALVPGLGARGAALSMLATEVVLAVLLVRTAVREVGSLAFGRTAGAPLVAGAAMAAALALASAAPLAVALALGGAVYLAAYVLAEHRLAPGDLAFLRRAIASRAARVS